MNERMEMIFSNQFQCFVTVRITNIATNQTRFEKGEGVIDTKGGINKSKTQEGIHAVTD